MESRSRDRYTIELIISRISLEAVIFVADILPNYVVFFWTGNISMIEYIGL